MRHPFNTGAKHFDCNLKGTQMRELLTVAIFSTALLTGCANALLQQKALGEKVSPVLTELKQRQNEANNARLELYAVASLINEKGNAADVDALVPALCASPPPIPGDALDTRLKPSKNNSPS